MASQPRAQLKIIAGQDRGRRLAHPTGNRIRPTPSMAREALFNIIQENLLGSAFLDLYAGTGAVGLEALSRGAASTTLVEDDREAAELIRENIHSMARAKDCYLKSARVENQVAGFARRKEVFDFVFVDPPYENAGIPIRELEPILQEGGVVIHQRPHHNAIGDPFAGTTLEQVDSRRYGKAVLTFWSRPIGKTE